MAREHPVAPSARTVKLPRWNLRTLRLPKGALALYASERRFLLFVVDALVLSSALFLALWARTAIFAEMEQVGFFPVQAIWWLVLIAVWVPIALVFDCYDLRSAADPVRGAVNAMGCTLLVAGIYLVFPIYSAPLTRSRLAWFLFALLAVVGEGLWRLTYARLFDQAAFSRRVLIVGAGGAGRSLGSELVRLGSYVGVELAGYVDDNPALRDREVVPGAWVLGDCSDLTRLVSELEINDLVVAITNTSQICAGLMEALVACWTNGVNVFPMPVYYERVTGAIPAQHLGQNLFALVGGNAGVATRLWLVVRRLTDLVVGVVGLAVTVAIAPVIALAIVVESPGPVLYTQDRVGRGGRRFRLAKFRTMVPDAEPNGAAWATRDDPRKTRVGCFLRRTRLDELPQFWNLIDGSMTLIGPRPERPEFVEQLSRELPYYPIRHSVTPGLTGWAQVRFRYAASVDDSLQKLCYDLYYIKHRGPALDALICLYTLRTIVRMEGS